MYSFTVGKKCKPHEKDEENIIGSVMCSDAL